MARVRCSRQRLVAGIKEYAQESSLHGLRYLADPGRHWVERSVQHKRARVQIPQAVLNHFV
jgi:hypothetical protein